MLIFINPGHSPNGTPDPGVVSANGRFESDIAALIANETAEFLDNAGLDVLVKQLPELEDISWLANISKADYFVSIHCNASASHSARGMEVFYYEGSKVGKALASSIHDEIASSVPNTDRGIKTANFHVIRATNMPAVLVETAFLDNISDEQLLIRFHKEYAGAIARGITNMLQ